MLRPSRRRKDDWFSALGDLGIELGLVGHRHLDLSPAKSGNCGIPIAIRKSSLTQFLSYRTYPYPDAFIVGSCAFLAAWRCWPPMFVTRLRANFHHQQPNW